MLAHRLVRGDVMLPVHWGLFDLALHGWTEPIERVLVAAADSQSVRVAAPRPGDMVEPATLGRPVQLVAARAVGDARRKRRSGRVASSIFAASCLRPPYRWPPHADGQKAERGVRLTSRKTEPLAHGVCANSPMIMQGEITCRSPTSSYNGSSSASPGGAM